MGNEDVDLAVGPLPDLGTGRLVVDPGVGRVGELPREDRAGSLRCDPMTATDVVESHP